MNVIKSITISDRIGREEDFSINFSRRVYNIVFTKTKFIVNEVKQINRIETDLNEYGVNRIPNKMMFESYLPYDKVLKSKYEFLIEDIHEITNFMGIWNIKFNDGKEFEESFWIDQEIPEKEKQDIFSDLNNTIRILKNHNIDSKIQLEDTIYQRINELLINLNEVRINKNEHVIENETFLKILKNNQSKIIEIDREYVQKFIKLNNYLKEKSSNLSVILDKIIYNLENESKGSLLEREDEINFFKGLVYSYNLMFNHSIVMVTSLVEDDMIVFYETYEVFDKMNVFNTNWENEVNDKLSEINESLHDLNFSIRGLMNQIRDMEMKLVKGLNQINSSINTSIGSLENSVNKQLSETNSRLKYENLTNYYKKSTLPGVMDWFDGP